MVPWIAELKFMEMSVECIVEDDMNRVAGGAFITIADLNWLGGECWTLTWLVDYDFSFPISCLI